MRNLTLRAAVLVALVAPAAATAQQPKETFEQTLQRMASEEAALDALNRDTSTDVGFYSPTSFQDDEDAKDKSAGDFAKVPGPDDTDKGDDDNEDVFERLKALEKNYEALEKNYSNLEKDHKSLSKEYDSLDEDWTEFLSAEKKKKSDAAKKPTFQINGRIHLDYWTFPNPDEGIGFFEHDDVSEANFGTDPEDFTAFRRVRLEMKGDVLDWGLWRIQVDFNNPAAPEMRDVYIGFKNLPANQKLLIGNQKRPLGLDHLNSSRYNIFLERPFVVEAFNEDARRIGAAMYGHTDDEMYHWQYGAYFLENVGGDGRVLGDNLQMSLNARLASSPWYDEASGGRGYYHWAVAGMAGHANGTPSPADGNLNEARFRTRPEARSQSRWLSTGRIDGADWFYIGAVESMLNVGAFQLTGEFQYNQTQRDSGFANTSFYGGYAYASYFLTGEHIPYNRKSGTIGRVKPFENFFLVDRCNGGTSNGWGAFALAARYSYLDISDEDILGGVGESVTFALNWHWTAYSKVQFNLIRGRIDDHAAVGGFTSGDYTIFGARFALEF